MTAILQAINPAFAATSTTTNNLTTTQITAVSQSCVPIITAFGAKLVTFEVGMKQLQMNASLLLNQVGANCNFNIQFLTNITGNTQNAVVLSQQLLQHYAIHVNFDQQLIAFDGDVVIDKTPATTPFPTWAIIVIIIAILLVVGGAVGCFIVKRRKALEGELNTYNQLGK